MYHDATVLVMLTISEPNIADQKPATLKLSHHRGHQAEHGGVQNEQE